MCYCVFLTSQRRLPHSACYVPTTYNLGQVNWLDILLYKYSLHFVGRPTYVQYTYFPGTGSGLMLKWIKLGNFDESYILHSVLFNSFWNYLLTNTVTMKCIPPPPDFSAVADVKSGFTYRRFKLTVVFLHHKSVKRMFMYSCVSVWKRVKVTCLYVIYVLLNEAVSRPDYTFESYEELERLWKKLFWHLPWNMHYFIQIWIHFPYRPILGNHDRESFRNQQLT